MTPYFISQEILDGVKLKPRIPSNYLTDNGYADKRTPRISFSTSVSGALSMMLGDIRTKEFYVYTIPNINVNEIYTPSLDQVPDRAVTDEIWMLKPTKLIYYGKIKVTDTKSQPIPYIYGGNKKGHIFRWNYTWLDRKMRY